MRSRIRSSIRDQAGLKVKQRIYGVKNVVLTALFVIISSGLLIQLQQYYQSPEGSGQSQTVNEFSLNWDLESIYSEKNKEGYAFYEKGNPEQVGMAEFVTDEEKNKIINTSAMNMAKEMVNFPYPTSLYIEHVKMMDVSLRYHFFVEAGKETIHFSFDYPKLEYAEIFQVISSLDFIEPKPYRHKEQLYVTHGYGNLPYPVGLSPVESIGDIEKYVWEQGLPEQFKEYIDQIKSTGIWKQINDGVSSYTFESADGSEVVEISLKGKEITYQYSYPDREE
ncbi:hypothetical protein [Bacillus sp. ISL-55]|uniref:hypothetical protein n=1 Tax=Bacillus sp. ISL-55 TaxID=2819134 RepID=UPI001BEABCC6|nr:hypothetical protein [Bacillus sp. ISL-55]